MPLLRKLRISLVLIAVIPLALFGWIAYITSTNNLAALERDALASGLEGANRAFLEIEQNQARINRDYAYWDELHEQVEKGQIDPEWQKANLDADLVTSPIQTFSLDALGIWTREQKPLFTHGPAQNLYNIIGKNVLERSFTDDVPVTLFSALFGKDIYLVTIASTRTGNSTDPNGIMIFARKLGAQDIESVTALIGNPVSFYYGTALIAGTLKTVPAPDQVDLTSVAKDGLRRFDQARSDYAVAYAPIQSPSGDPVATLVMWRPRTVLRTSQAVISSTLGLTFVIGSLLALVAAFLLGRSIVRPIGLLSNNADRMAAGNLQQRIDISVLPNDELGRLGTAFNHMTDQLAYNLTELQERIREVDTKNYALQAATSKAEGLARTRGEFLSTMSHELRTPLNAIIGFSDMLLMGMGGGTLNNAQQSYVNRLKDNSLRLLNLVNDVLDVSRIDAGRIVLHPTVFAPKAMFSRIAAQMQVLADEKSLRFQTSFAPDLDQPIFGDEKRLEQIVVNLLSNAFKFTKKGTVDLSVSIQAEAKQWTIIVCDTGIGIPTQAFDLIFEPFRQVDGSASRSYAGAGLGLAISQQLIQMMGGKITLESAVGTGSTFTVTLPLAEIPIEGFVEMTEMKL